MSDGSNIKQMVVDLIRNLPNDVTLENIQYHLFVMQKILMAEQQIEDGKIIPHKDVMEKLKKKWFP